MTITRDTATTIDTSTGAIDNRLFDIFSLPLTEYWEADMLGYIGYLVRWLTPDGSQFLCNFAGSYPDKQKLVHTHPGKDSIIIFLDGKADFLIGGQQRIPAKPGDVLLSPGGRPHGVKNTGTGVCRWMYMEGPLPLTTEFPIYECCFNPLGNVDNPITGNKVGPFGMSGNTNILKDSATISGMSNPWTSDGDKPAPTLRDPQLYSPAVQSKISDQLFNRVSSRTFSPLDVSSRVRLGKGFSTKVHAPDYEQTQLFLMSPSVETTMPLHRYTGADQVVLMVEGEADFIWSPADGGPTVSREFRPGMLGFALNGESYGIRNRGDRPAKLMSLVGLSCLDDGQVVWPDGEEPGDLSVES